MKKIYIILLISILLSGCSSFNVKNLSDTFYPNKDLRFRIRQLAESLDSSLKFLRMKQEKLAVNTFKPMNNENRLLGEYIREKLIEELFKLGYLITAEGNTKIDVSGVYIDTGKNFEIIASIEGEGLRISEASVTISKKYLSHTNFLNQSENFLSGER